MKVLVLGGTGTVGSHVVRELATRGVDVSGLTRDPSKAKDLPRGVKAVQGALMSPATNPTVVVGLFGVYLRIALSVS